jgi:hypothetical protein
VIDPSVVPNLSQSIPSHTIQNSELPLTVYRELAAHLRQVTGVEAELLPQRSRQFNYRQSQVGGIEIRYTTTATEASQQRVAQILQYYGDRYGAWESVEP